MRALSDEDSNDDGGTVFRDVIMLALAGFVAMVILLLPHLNPSGEDGLAVIDVREEVYVEVRWPDELDSDVDLWVEAPGDIPVGYSNKGGAIFNLLRDDRGKKFDATKMNYEAAFTRGIPSGEYTVNLYFYENFGAEPPIPVTVTTRIKKWDPDGRLSGLLPILTQKVLLLYPGQELTAYRFQLGDDHKLVPGSVSSLQRNIAKRSKL